MRMMSLRIGTQHYILRSGFAAWRTQSEKSCASGLRVLFFNVTSASGLAVSGKSIGKVRSNRLFGGKCMTTRGTIDK
jgi:hypothetical protein